MLDPEFYKCARSNNGHYYVKMLKEKIAGELNLSEPAQASDFAFAKIIEDTRERVDVEGKYNLSDINNLNAMGYENIEKRAANHD
jgi:hypothetical protein